MKKPQPSAFVLQPYSNTIVAISTPIGMGAIGIVRLSGPKAHKIAHRLWQASSNQTIKPNCVNIGWIVEHNIKLDQAVAIFLGQPNSYTGEDMVELHCHGSAIVLNKIVALSIEYGAEPAEAGEFSRRAYTNGKLDLIQAEAVGELIHAESETAMSAASSQLAGGLSKQLEHIKQTLVELAAAETANLDFGEEDIEVIGQLEFIHQLKLVHTKLFKLIAQKQYAPIVRDGIHIALVGLPNAGKSTLLNSILGYERAIVTEVAGTTRDTLTESVQFGGVALHFTDTAGLRLQSGKVEAKGIERSIVALQQASVVVLLVEPGQINATELYLSKLEIDLQPKKTILVHTKQDLDNKPEPTQLNPSAIVQLSAQQNIGVRDLLQTIFDLTVGKPLNLNITVMTERQFLVLQQVEPIVKKLIADATNNIPRDVLLVLLQESVERICELDGSSASEAIIAEVFKNFCIGK